MMQKHKNSRWHLLGLITMILTLIAILVVLPLLNGAQAA
jgi:hypothetical protein